MYDTLVLTDGLHTSRDRVNAEIMHFYAKKFQKCSIKILMRPRMQDVDLKNSLHLLWKLNRFCCLSDVTNFRTKLSDFTSWPPYWIYLHKGDWRRFTHLGNLNELPPMFVCCLIGQVATMNHEKGGRHNEFLDKWLKEFGWLQTRGSGDYYFIDDL